MVKPWHTPRSKHPITDPERPGPFIQQAAAPKSNKSLSYSQSHTEHGRIDQRRSQYGIHTHIQSDEEVSQQQELQFEEACVGVGADGAGGDAGGQVDGGAVEGGLLLEVKRELNVRQHGFFAFEDCLK
jgi:hypothetical protein